MTRTETVLGNGAPRVGAFDEAAADFVRLAPHLWDPLAAATLANAVPAPGDRVLDACCGTGASAVLAAVAVGTTGRVDAVDISPAMIDQLGRRRTELGLTQLHPVAADLTAWDEDGYDLVVSVMGIFFLPDLARDTATLVSRCRPDGRVVLTIWRRGAMDDFGAALMGTVAEVTGRPLPPPRPHHLIDEINDAPAYQTWLTGLGLTGVEVQEHRWTIPLDPDLIWLMVLGSGFRGMLQGLTTKQVAAVRSGLVRRVIAAGGTIDASDLVGLGFRPAAT